MRRNTRETGFAGAVFITALIAGLMLLLTCAMLVGFFKVTWYLGETPGPLVTGMVLLWVFLLLSVAVGAVKALYQRWREIEKGELDEARKY